MKATSRNLESSPLEPLSDEYFRFLQEVIERKTGIQLVYAKKALLESRLKGHLNQLGLPSWGAYCQVLKGARDNEDIWQDVINRMTTNKTGFFREAAHFKILVERLIPKWKQTAQGRPLRIWSAACSTGEEAYTLAMVVQECLQGACEFEIVASDIDSSVLSAAVNGVYPASRLLDVPREFYKYFERGTGPIAGWCRVTDQLKKRVKFQTFNLITDRPPWRDHFDIIFCRNVFIYFSAETIQAVVASFAQALRPQGYLFTGHAESLSETIGPWKRLDSTLYQKQGEQDKVEAKQSRSISKMPISQPTATVQTSSIQRRVLIIDDSQTVCQLLEKVLSSSAQLRVVGKVTDPRLALESIRALKPHVVTLDINMPHIDGLSLLKMIMQQCACPVVMISSLHKDEGHHVLEALELGAIDYIEKPAMDQLSALTPLMCEKIFVAASAKIIDSVKPKPLASSKQDKLKSQSSKRKTQCIVIGSSTGGTDALRRILCDLPERIPPILIAQHIPPGFSDLLAKRLDKLCPFHVKEAASGDVVQAGTVYITPGGQHMRVTRVNENLVIRITKDEDGTRHKPSIDYLMRSVGESGIQDTIGVILTGMGSDGAQGLLAMKRQGAMTIAQDEATSVVFGMPKEAIKIGAADKVCALQNIASLLSEWI